MNAVGQPVIGVLGGMGPEATLGFYARLVAATEAARDQDHARVIIDSNPAIPDRTAAVLGQGPSPVPAMSESIGLLQRAGADLVVIPCVSAHAFFAEVRSQAGLPILSILDAVAEEIETVAPRIERVGLLATTGTLRAGLFQPRLTEAGIAVVEPDPRNQELVMSAIYSVKGGGVRARAAADLHAVADRLIHSGAQAILLGCTEIPLVFDPSGFTVPVFDSLLILARAALKAAGRQPRFHPALAGAHAR